MSKRMTKQLKDPTFRKWMAKVPRNRIPGSKNWRIWVQKKKGGRWYKLKVDFATYKEAYTWFAKNLNKYHDIALTSKVTQYRPPADDKGRTVLPPSNPQDWWCSFCRRMTTFKYFSKHHAIPDYYLLPYEKYCEICGGRMAFAVQGASRVTTPKQFK